MKKPSKPKSKPASKSKTKTKASDTKPSLRDKIIGLGESSIRKSYYPQLREQLDTLEEMRQELDESRARYRSLIENINDVIFSLDIKGVVTYISPVIQSLTGFMPDEVIGKSFREFIHPDDLSRVESGFESIMGGNIEPREYRVLVKGGTYRDVRSSSRPLLEEGQVVGLTGVMSDITERKRIEKELEFSEEKFSKAFYASPNLMAMTRPEDGMIVEINESFCRFFGYKREECIGHNTSELNMWVDPEQRGEIVRQLEKSSAALYVPVELRTKSGEIRSVIDSLVFIEIDNQKYLLSVATDITERKKMEHDLIARENDFRTLVENSPDPILRYDRDCKRVYINPVIGRISGKPLESLIGSKPTDGQLLSDSEAKKLTAAIRKTFDSDQANHVDFDFVDLNGDLHSYDMLLIPEHDADGQVETVLGIAHNITERKQAERKIEESEKKFRSLAESLPDNIVRYDRQGRTTYVNPALEKTLGVPASEMIGTCIRDLNPDGSYEDYAQAVDDALASGENSEIELVVPDGTGKTVHQIRFIVERDEQEEVSGVLAIGRDISERKQAEEELKRSEQALAEAQRIAKVGSWEVAHSEGGKLSWSDEMYEIHEVDKESFAVSNESFLATVHPDDRDMVNHTHDDSLARQQDSYEVSYHLQTADGRIKYVHEQGRNYFDGEGRALRSVGTVQDVTRHHEMEMQLLHAQKMEAVGTLVGGIAHDFNNKLAAIIANLYLAKREVDSESPAVERLHNVETLSQEAAAMVHELLVFARKGKIEQQPLSLSHFIKETAKLNRVVIPEDIDFTVNVCNNPLTVVGDITQLQQAFLNLLTNARDALEHVKGARIEVDLSEYRPDAHFLMRHPEAAQFKSFASIRVTDNGKGIDAEHYEHIFDPFYTTKEVGKGTGLGLAMVYGVVQSHRGFVDVESTPDKGSCFTIFLPLSQDDNAAVRAADVDDMEMGHGETILIADDDDNVRKTFSEVLAALGYNVLAASNGREAVDLFQQHAADIDLVILDIVMPGLRGPEVAQLIREVRPKVKVIYATGYNDRNEAVGVGEDVPMLCKPYMFQQVNAIIQEQLKR